MGRQYMDPGAAAHAESEYAYAVYLMGQHLSRVSNTNVCGLAASLAHTYISSDGPADALNYYRSNRFSQDMRDEAITALAAQSLYGNNGSDAWMAYSIATRWAPDTTDPYRYLSERERQETTDAAYALRSLMRASTVGHTMQDVHAIVIGQELRRIDDGTARRVRAFDRALVFAECEHTVSDEVGMVTSCGHGCKVWRCRTCGAQFDVHYRVYGCTHPGAA